MKRYANLPNMNKVSIELHPKVTPIDDDDHVMITEKFAPVRS